MTHPTPVRPLPGPAVAWLPGVVVVATHFPPALGGVQTFAYEFTRRLPADRVTVVAPQAPGAAAFDRRQPFDVRRVRGPLSGARHVLAVLRDLIGEGVNAVWLPAAAPSAALLLPLLRRAGASRIVVSTHGQELSFARLPTRVPGRALLGHADVVTTLGDFTAQRLSPMVPAGVQLARLPGGVDSETFRPHPAGVDVRRQLRLTGRSVVISVSRLVARKGQDTLLQAWPRVLAGVPDAVAVLVGDGPSRRRLRTLADRLGISTSVRFAGPVHPAELPAYLSAADVYTLPCRTRLAGFDVEGLGLSTLEASAVGLPVVVGRSGGSVDSVLDGQTGYLVDPQDPAELADRLTALLTQPLIARRLGHAGRRWVSERWSWDGLASRLTGLLVGP